jgi:stage 0 sporulation protein A homolog
MKGDIPMSNNDNTFSAIQLNVSQLLINLGIPLSLSGHRYLCTAVNIYHSLGHTDNRIKITKDIYPAVAKQYGTTSQCVERSIRHAVEICFMRGDLKLIGKMFGSTINETKGKPTNGEFISTVAYWMENDILSTES